MTRNQALDEIERGAAIRYTYATGEKVLVRPDGSIAKVDLRSFWSLTEGTISSRVGSMATNDLVVTWRKKEND